jgi:hypothetical protein
VSAPVHLVAEGVTPFALSALKYGLFALLVLFLWRSMRWAVRGLSVEAAPARGGRLGRRSREENDEGAPTVTPGLSDVVVHADGQKPRTVRVNSDSLVIGRAPECELAIEDTYVSQQHARVFAKGGSWYVEDLGSTNGTFVNEQRLSSPAMVQSGDKVRVGTTVMELRR